jgi:PAS domain S-box-containing protein
MKDESETNQQLVPELAALRQRLAELKVEETGRLRAEAALQASETRYRRLFEAAQDGIFILDADTGQIADVNPFLIKMLGYSREEFVGKKLWEMGPFKNIEASKAAFAELQHSGYIRYEDLPLETSDGQHIDVEFVSNVYLVDHKKVIQCNIRDITARKRAEEIAIQASRMQVAVTLAGGVAHRINNLMTSVLGYAELIKDNLIGQSESLEMLDTIAQPAREASDLAQQMLAFAGGGKYQPRIINLNDTINEVMQLWIEQHAVPTDIHLLRHLAPDLWRIKADAAQMSQVLVNLLTNALEAMSDSGQITVSTSNIMNNELSGGQPGPYTCLTIQDTGSGMSKELQSRIFEPFFTTKFQGHGLGLPAVYGIVQNHGGNVVVHSQPGQGTRVMVYLPALLPVAGPS